MAEIPTNNSTHFISGAGGFLQQVIFGYTGLRLSEKGLAQKFKPMLPKGVTKLLLKNFSVKGKKHDIVVEKEKNGASAKDPFEIQEARSQRTRFL